MNELNILSHEDFHTKSGRGFGSDINAYSEWAFVDDTVDVSERLNGEYADDFAMINWEER